MRPGDRLVSYEEAARTLGISLADLHARLAKCNGPVLIRIGGRDLEIDRGSKTIKAALGGEYPSAGPAKREWLNLNKRHRRF